MRCNLQIITGYCPVICWHKLQFALPADTATLVINYQCRVVNGAVSLAKMGSSDDTGDGVCATRRCNRTLALEQGGVPIVTDG